MIAPRHLPGPKTYALLFTLLFLPYAYFNHSDGWNQLSRLGELRAVVIKGTIRIDDYHTDTGDKALYQGHYYSEKAPAIALIALPAFGATVLAQRAMGIDPDATHARSVSAWIATAGSVGVVAALGGVALFALSQASLGVPLAFLATMAVCLGSIWFPYATALFAHAGTMGLLAIAIWGTFTASRSPRRDVVAGVAAGLAVASEYPAVLAVAGLALYLWHQDRQRALRFLAAAIPGVLTILIKNYLVTGSPLQLSYGFNPQFPRDGAQHNFGHDVPNPRVFGELLWGQFRGLFFWSPALLMALPGLVVLARTERAMAAVLAGVSLASLAQAGSFYHWEGGSAVGPRYLAQSIPFLGVATAHGIKRFPKTGALLTILSVGLMGMVTAIDLGPPDDVMNPLRDYYMARLQTGRLAPNLGTLIGLSIESSLLVLLAAWCLLGWLLIRQARGFTASSQSQS